MSEPARVGPAGRAPGPAMSGPVPGASAGVGAPAEVRNRFDGRWSPGFRVERVEEREGHLVVRVRRLSDGYVVPTWFPVSDVRTPPNA